MKIDENTIMPEEATSKAEPLFRALVWQDASRTEISWNEFWVYMCNYGIKPNDDEWLYPLSPEELRAKLMGKLGKIQKKKKQLKMSKREMVKMNKRQRQRVHEEAVNVKRIKNKKA